MMEILFGIATNENTACSFNPETGEAKKFDVYPFNYNSLQATAEEIFIQLIQTIPSGAVPGWTVWSGHFGEEEKKQLLEVADYYNFKKIHFINVETAWSLNLLKNFNQKLVEGEKIGLIFDLGKIIEGNLYRVLNGKLIRVKMAYQISDGELTRKFAEKFRSKFLKGRKCDIILIEYYNEPVNYQEYFNKKTLVTVPYDKFNTAEGALIKAKNLQGGSSFVDYEIVTKTDNSLDVVDYEESPLESMENLEPHSIQIEA
ncbi:hypothetical protein FO519_003857 [Halicephalobus sp. NKZ332]|nr:hypothetical protein FO519_003857 [Halicephalobus sp. NKZ332]